MAYISGAGDTLAGTTAWALIQQATTSRGIGHAGDESTQSSQTRALKIWPYGSGSVALDVPRAVRVGMHGSTITIESELPVSPLLSPQELAARMKEA